MKKFLNVFKENNIQCGYLYFYIHLITEVVCFYYLSILARNSIIIWLVPLFYDCFAFVPQSIIGRINDKYKKIDFGIIGTILMIMAYLIKYFASFNIYVPLFILCIGNAFLHISGAETTINNSNGKLAHSAIFVAGGSFGVVIGKLLAIYNIYFGIIILCAVSIIPAIMLANTYKSKELGSSKFDYANKKMKPALVIFLAVFVVIIRGYMGYGIPTTWNKTTLQLIIFYSIMGVGKALGGILSDAFGIRKVAFISTICSIPFLCFGDNIMIISIIGIMFFSMTMAITLAILVSVLKNTPGLAFGLTTIGLFLGTAPIFFVKITSLYINIGLIIVSSILCCFILLNILNNDKMIREGDNH